MDKINKIVELKIDDDEFSIDKLGLEIISFVEYPAIEVNWKSFNKQEFESYNDYDDGIRNNAKRGIELNEKNGNKCATQTGKVRAQQLANGEKISVETIKRMYSYLSRAEVYYDQSDDTSDCGYISFLLWGGKSALSWSRNKLRELGEIDLENLQFNEDKEMVDGVIDLLKKVQDPQNRQDIAVSIIKDFIDEGVDFDLDNFLEQIEVQLGIDTSNLRPYKDQIKKPKPKPQHYSKYRDVELTDINYGDYVFSIDQQIEVLKYADEVGLEIGQNDVILELKKEGFSFIKDILKGLMVIDSLTTNQAASDEGEIFYRYGGQAPERNFCNAMLRLNKVYTYEDIQQMEQRGINIKFGHEGQPYSIWNYKGGPYCKHYWSKLEIFRGEKNDKVIIDHGPVDGLPGTKPHDMANGGHHPDWVRQHMMSLNAEKRIVMGPLLIPNKMILREENGQMYYVYFTKDTIKKISEKAFKDNVHNNTDINHSEDITQQNTLLESWIIEDTKYDKSYKYGFNLPVGTWMVSYKVNDDTTWNKIKSGELRGFSAAGYFLEKDKKETQSRKDLEKIIEILDETEL